MSDGRWLDVEDDSANAVEHFRMAEALYRLGRFDEPGLEGYGARMALMHAMQSGHTSAEAALLRIIDILDETRPTGPDWHEVLIRRLSRPADGRYARPAVLPEELATDLNETRRFRHRAMHAYDDFDIERFAPAIMAAARIASAFSTVIVTFRKQVEPD